ncbi:MAG TPA: hypothetical protein C5S50_04620 [Methanosarcinaceae archaeon]|nr:hypothetical protein [Methanosarcinaceae archaeon]
MRDKVAIADKAQRLVDMTAGFCDEYLDEEYEHLCDKLIKKMGRKRNVPYLSGKMEIWAAAIVYALGQMNFLFDKSTTPFASADDICNYFGTSKSTTSQKSKLIRDMFKMRYFDDEFSTSSVLKNSPYSDFVMMSDLIVSNYELPPELQDLLQRK